MEFLGATVGDLVIGIPGYIGITYSVHWGPDPGWTAVVTSSLGGYCVRGIIGASIGTVLFQQILDKLDKSSYTLIQAEEML